MVLTQEELKDWNMNTLKNYLTERGVTLSGGGSRKADLIRKVLAADLLQLPTLPSQEEIARRRLLKGEQHKITKISETYHILTYIYKK